MDGRQWQEQRWAELMADVPVEKAIADGKAFRCPACRIIHMGRYRRGTILESFCSSKCRKEKQTAVEYVALDAIQPRDIGIAAARLDTAREIAESLEAQAISPVRSRFQPSTMRVVASVLRGAAAGIREKYGVTK